jgi:hypothetical protein
VNIVFSPSPLLLFDFVRVGSPEADQAELIRASCPAPLGITIIGGLIASQLLTLYTTTVVYLYFDRAQNWLNHVLGRA